MNKEVSIYLDGVRFLAAMTVFLGHAAGMQITGGFLWPLGGYLQAAVMVFFVLSGYVIGYVAHEREHTLRNYAISRIARLYSVVIPALVLTALCDAIGLAINRHFYIDGPWGYPPASQIPNYLLSFCLMQNIWNLQLNPGINGPFWSLTCEFL